MLTAPVFCPPISHTHSIHRQKDKTKDYQENTNKNKLLLMSVILDKVDHFEDAATGGGEGWGQENIIHIRIQQRNGRKTLTTIQVGN